MRTATALNHRDRASRATRDLWRQARMFHMSHADILKRREGIRETIAHCPEWVRSFVYGQDRLLSDLVYEHLEFCYLVDGTLFSTSRDTDKRTTEEFYTAGRGHILCDADGHHYWKGTDKRYS